MLERRPKHVRVRQRGHADCTPAESPIVTVTAYSNVYDVYGKLISTFQSDWKESHNDQQVQFSTSFGGSTTQAQNVVAGFPADVAALSLYPDIQLIEDAGLITHDPKQDPEGGIVATSAVVFDVRPGNPLNIDNWDDLAKPGVEILTPDPASSGGARWNIVAAYGAAMRGEVPGYAANDPAAAQQLLTDIFSNVTVMDKSANDSIKNFQAGNGDVALTYEYAVLASQNSGLEDEMVIPPSTVAIQTPVSVVDANADDALRAGRRGRVRGVPALGRGEGALPDRGLRAVGRPEDRAGRRRRCVRADRRPVHDRRPRRLG